jgi:hypothetical protein
MFLYWLGRTYLSYAGQQVVVRTRQEITINNKARKNTTRQHQRAQKMARLRTFSNNTRKNMARQNNTYQR